MTRRVDITAFASAHASGAYVIDVREPDEYEDGHVPGARLVPMGQFGNFLDSVPADQDVYLVCRSGNRSGKVADAFGPRGFSFINVEGGTMAWVAEGHPVNVGARP